MKRQKKINIAADLEELIPLLIAEWRKLQKLPVGPANLLQTREFRSLVDAIIQRQEDPSILENSQLGAYMLYDWILQYQQGISLIQELPSTPYRVLDLFSKAAPFAIAALRCGANEVFALDHHPQALKLGATICGKFGHTISIREHDCKRTSFPVEGKWDLIIVGHALLNEFEHTPQQAAYVESLLAKLSDTGHLLLVESSMIKENRRFLMLRDALVQKGAAIAAPCIWAGSCPMLQHASSPCFAQRPFEKPFLIKEIQRAAHINLSSLKMSYLIIKAPGSGRLAIDGKRLYRVVSPPIETFRGTRHFLCGTDGKRTLGSRLKEHPKHSRAYEYLKRGDVISIDQPLAVKDDLEITPDTTVLLEAPCGKPLPIVDESFA